MGAASFTGERPGWGEGLEYDYGRHVAAYRFAAAHATGRRVLDAGCGEGFGTQMLADVARDVTGVDYSPVAIDQCRRLWSRPNLRFELLDLERPAGFTDTFDLVLSFQVIEHIEEPRPFVERLRDRLNPGGTLILTTPNRLRSSSENPYHVREYVASELEEMLSGLFDRVDIAGIHGNAKVEVFETRRAEAVARILRLDPLGVRHVLPRKVVELAFAKLARLVRRQARPPGEDITPDDFFVSAERLDDALDLVATCKSD